MNHPDYIALLQRLVETPSTSRDESATADILDEWLTTRGVKTRRVTNNVIAYPAVWDADKPTLLLNSHHDTVKPNTGYTRQPYKATIEAGKLYGLGSNDAGGPLVALTAAFMYFKDRTLPFNIVLCLSAEEECSGVNGIRLALQHLGRIDMAIVGEPTCMKCAVGERGLLVLDCITHGNSGHAARFNGESALYKTIDDINRLRNLRFERESALMGRIGLNVTMIECGTQHNVIPATCKYVVDVRTTDAYTNEETLDIIRSTVNADVTPRSTHLRASAIEDSHPLVQAVDSLGIEKFLSPTMSDMALMPFPSIKIGPGDSCRSHQANEYVGTAEIDDGIEIYKRLIENIRI